MVIGVGVANFKDKLEEGTTARKALMACGIKNINPSTAKYVCYEHAIQQIDIEELRQIVSDMLNEEEAQS